LEQSPKGSPIAHPVLSHDEPRHVQHALLDQQVHLFLHGLDAIPKSLNHSSHLRLKDLSDSALREVIIQGHDLLDKRLKSLGWKTIEEIPCTILIVHATSFSTNWLSGCGEEQLDATMELSHDQVLGGRVVTTTFASSTGTTRHLQDVAVLDVVAPHRAIVNQIAKPSQKMETLIATVDANHVLEMGLDDGHGVRGANMDLNATLGIHIDVDEEIFVVLRLHGFILRIVENFVVVRAFPIPLVTRIVMRGRGIA